MVYRTGADKINPPTKRKAMTDQTEKRSWKAAVATFWHPRVITMLFLGFSAGIPILLIFSSLSLWLREAGIERSTVTFFSWAALGYSFKFVWAPLVDRLPVPVLTRLLGRRRSWMLTAQSGIVTSICLMALTDPSAGGHTLTIMAIGAVLLGFSSATQDIVIDAYRIESAGSELQAMMASTYIAGYRIAMILAGAGALFLADYFGSTKSDYSFAAWSQTYLLMAGSMLVGIVTTLLIPEPKKNNLPESDWSAQEYVRFLFLFGLCITAFILTFFYSATVASNVKATLTSFFGNKHIAGVLIEALRLAAAITTSTILAKILIEIGIINREMMQTTYIDPVKNFFSRYGWGLAWLLLALIGLYRISDIVLGVISNVFYQDMGFSKTEIAAIVKTFGLIMTIVGGFAGGILSARYGVMRILFLGALLSAATNILFMGMAGMDPDIRFLYIVISADNLAAGIAGAAFVAFLSGLTDIRFTAMQYAIFSSLMTLMPKMIGGYSGTMVDSLGYPLFFLITALMGVPVLILIGFAGRHISIDQPD